MATQPEQDEFDFDGYEPTPVEKPAAKQPEPAFEIEEEDDTPPEDRGRQPMPKEIVEDLDADEFEEYSEKVKQRLVQAKKIYHDERREKERVQRENQEAIALAQQLRQENQHLKKNLFDGEDIVVKSFIQAAELEHSAAQRAYKEAYDAGETDKIIEAQRSMTAADIKLDRLRNYKPTLQPDETQVAPQNTGQPQVPTPDAKTVAWQKRNDWFGADPEMTAAALGLHQKLMSEYGASFNGTDRYWAEVDKTMRLRFPEHFGEETQTAKPRAANVVAPATRSASPQKVKLTKSQLAIAKKFGLTPHQYAAEVLKMEQKND